MLHLHVRNDERELWQLHGTPHSLCTVKKSQRESQVLACANPQVSSEFPVSWEQLFPLADLEYIVLNDSLNGFQQLQMGDTRKHAYLLHLFSFSSKPFQMIQGGDMT